jgi:ATP-dependent Clp protease ATP-binding subunit ClpC
MNVSDGRSAAILREANVDTQRYFMYLQKVADKQTVISGSMFTARTKRLFETAVDISLKARAGFVGTEHLLLAVLQDSECMAVVILRQLRVNVDRIISELEDALFGGIEG